MVAATRPDPGQSGCKVERPPHWHPLRPGLPARGATHLANCLLCLPGTYSLTVGRTSNCPTCPANFYCRTSTLKQACPTHTTSPAGSYSILKCICDPGFSCTYYKQIQAIVTLNTTLHDFNNDVAGIKTGFLSAMGAAANVSASQVVINGVIEIPPAQGGRRLLTDPGNPLRDSLEAYADLDDLFADKWPEQPPDYPARAGRALLSAQALPPAAGGIHVFASVRGSGRLHRLEHHLARVTPGLHIAHRWEQAHKVYTAPRAA